MNPTNEQKEHARESLDDLSYDDRYDATVVKGLCLECGGEVEGYWSLGEWFKPVWCNACKFELHAKGATTIGDQ